MLEGTYDSKTKTMTYVGEGIDPNNKAKYREKMVTTMKDYGTKFFTLTMKFDGSKDEVKLMEISYKKRNVRAREILAKDGHRPGRDHARAGTWLDLGFGLVFFPAHLHQATTWKKMVMPPRPELFSGTSYFRDVTVFRLLPSGSQVIK